MRFDVNALALALSRSHALSLSLSIDAKGEGLARLGVNAQSVSRVATLGKGRMLGMF